MFKVVIPQHSEDSKKLFDIVNFVVDIDLFFTVTDWEIFVDWCTGENSANIEKQSRNGVTLSNSAFREMYSGVTQTIDGEFLLKESELVVAKLVAIDSTCWDIESTHEGFIRHMKEKYGVFQHPISN